MNIPNLITLLRFFLIPVFVLFFFSKSEYGILLSVFVFVLAGITDVIDGFIARRYNQITKFGVVMDPLADKLMLITALISITIRFDVKLWVLGIVVLKELIMISGAVRLYTDDIVIPANKLGKISTILSYAAILSITLNIRYSMLLLYLFILPAIAALFVYLNNYANIRRVQGIGIEENKVDKM